MTKKDESPEEATNPYWSDELLAVLAEALGDGDRARQTLECIIRTRARRIFANARRDHPAVARAFVVHVVYGNRTGRGHPGGLEGGRRVAATVSQQLV